MINYKPAVKVLIWCLPVALCVLLFGCKDDQNTTVTDFKYDYYPIDSGHYVAYQVDSIFCYRTDFKKDTVSFQLKEVVGDTFYDNQNELNYELNLYRRANNNAQWIFDRRWFVKKTITNIQKNEDEIRFVKLVFPPQSVMGWDGNIFIPSGTSPYYAFQNWDYHYEGVDVPYSINSFNFDSTLMVVGVNDSTFIDKKLLKEVYAKHIGMVYQEYEIKNGSGPSSWETGQWQGFSIRMKLIDHN